MCVKYTGVNYILLLQFSIGYIQSTYKTQIQILVAPYKQTLFQLSKNNLKIDNSQIVKKQISCNLNNIQMNSGNNFCRNSSVNYSEVNSQRTLIYDLRSQLSNLKNQFSRLISKPSDQTAKSKVEPRLQLKTKYSQIDSEPGKKSEFSSYSSSQVSTKYCQSTPSLQFKHIDINNDIKSNPVPQKFNNTFKKPVYPETIATPGQSGHYEYITKANQYKKSQFQKFPIPYTKKYQDIGLGLKRPINNQQHLQKTNGSEKLSLKSSQISDFSSGLPTSNQALKQNQQRIKKLEEQNKLHISKINSSSQLIRQMEQKLAKFQRQIQEYKNSTSRKEEKIAKLQESVRQYTQKLAKANEVTFQIGRQKNRQFEMMKQNHSSQLKNQQKEIQKRFAIQKQNLQLKYDNIIRLNKQSYQSRLAQLTKEHAKTLQDLRISNQSLMYMKQGIAELESQKLRLQNDIKIFSIDGIKQSEITKSLLQKQSKLECQYKQKINKLQTQIKQNTIIKPETKEFGINCQQKYQVKSPVGSPQNNGSSAGALTSSNMQVKQLQQKLNIYLNNIDKQAQKIKQQKTELEKSQKIVEEYNRIIGQKENIIKNFMRDCKMMEKDLLQTRRIRKQAEYLLQEANQSIILINLKKTQQKYKQI